MMPEASLRVFVSGSVHWGLVMGSWWPTEVAEKNQTKATLSHGSVAYECCGVKLLTHGERKEGWD